MSGVGAYLKSLRTLVSPLNAFFAGTLLTCSAYGLLSSTLALQLNASQIPTFYAGIILAVYYVGYILASLTSHAIINRVGHIRAFSTFVSVLSALVLMHILSPNPWYWGVLRNLEGYCLGSSMMCLESWLNTRSNNQNRGVIMSVYMVTTYMGSACGQLLLNIPDQSGVIAFILVSVLYSVALVPISLTALPSPNITISKGMSLAAVYKLAPVGVVGCIVSGVMVGSVYTLGTIYAQKSGLNVEQTSLFMFFIIIGGMLAQLPVGRLSDKMDRRFVLMWEAGLLFLIAPWMHVFVDENLVSLAASALLLGSGVFVMYPICVSHVNDRIDDSQRVAASGLLILLQSIGMILGPVFISLAIQEFGELSFLFAFSAVNGFFVLFAFNHIAFRPHSGEANPTKSGPVPMAPTHMFNNLARDDTLLDKAKELFREKH